MDRRQQKKIYNDSERGKQKNMIQRWKQCGLIVEDYDKIYYRWKNSTHCEKCNQIYTIKHFRCMEHSHSTGNFRGIVCHFCNKNMLDDKLRTDNKSGHTNINYFINKKRYVYEKKYYKKRFTKSFLLKKDALCYKYINHLRFLAGHFPPV